MKVLRWFGYPDWIVGHTITCEHCQSQLFIETSRDLSYSLNDVTHQVWLDCIVCDAQLHIQRTNTNQLRVNVVKAGKQVVRYAFNDLRPREENGGFKLREESYPAEDSLADES